VVATLVVGVLVGGLGRVLPKGFIPIEDLGYVYLNIQLPPGASLERTSELCREVDRILAATPGVKYYTGVAGFSLLSNVFTTYNAFYFITLDPWAERVPKGLGLRNLLPILRERFGGLIGADAFPFPPPTIPGVGSSGGVTCAATPCAADQVVSATVTLQFHTVVPLIMPAMFGTMNITQTATMRYE